MCFKHSKIIGIYLPCAILIARFGGLKLMNQSFIYLFVSFLSFFPLSFVLETTVESL